MSDEEAKRKQSGETFPLALPLGRPGNPYPQQPQQPPPPPAPPPKPVTEQPDKTMPWLGAKGLWIGLAAATFAAFIAFVLWVVRVNASEALIPVVSLSGPVEVVKGEKARYAVLVRDRFGAPIQGATVRVGFYKLGLIELGRGKTGDGGDASVEVRFPEDFIENRSLVAVAEVGVTDGYDNLTVSPKAPNDGRAFVSTDKPIYQPGQTVHVRALVMAENKPVAKKPVTIEIRTPDNIKILQKETVTSAFGIVATDLDLADQVKLGSYSISVVATVRPAKERIKGPINPATDTAIIVTANKSFEVKRYALPKLKLAFEDLSTFSTDSPLKGTAHATWIWGEPVTKGTIHVTLDRVSKGNVIRQWSAPVDKDGKVHFSLPPSSSEQSTHKTDRVSYTLHAKLDIEGGLSTETSKDVSSSDLSSVNVEVFPENGGLVPGVTQTVYAVTTHEQKAGISVYAMVPQPPNATGSTPPPKKGVPAITNERGVATLSVHPEPGQSNVEIIAFAENGGQGSVVTTVMTDNTVLVRPDRPTYKPGETARVSVLGAAEGDHISIRMTKGSEPLATASCRVTSKQGDCEAVIPIPQDASGLAWIHAMSLPVGRPAGATWDWTAKHPVRVGKKLVLIGGGARDLDLRLAPDKTSYTPRETGVVAIDVLGEGGAPTKAQLGAGVIDEAVFALSDVRPDLEKIFFTVDKDLATARGSYSYQPSSHWRPSGLTYTSSRAFSERSLPAGFETADVYNPSTPADVDGVVLAALTAMSGTGGFEDANSSSISVRAIDAAERQTRRIAGFLLLFLTGLAMACFVVFGVYGARRFRYPEPLDEAIRNPTTFLIETRAFLVDWLVSILAPPAIGAISAISITAFDHRSVKPYAPWLVSGVFCAWLLLRAVLRLQRTYMLREATTFRRVLYFLPLASFLGQAATVLTLADEGTRLTGLFGFRQGGLVLPLLVIAATQITFGFLSVVRQTFVRHVTSQGRVWLLVSRACFLGLPLTLIGFAALLVAFIKSRNVGWDEYALEEREAEQLAESSSDNKEGGTGTRAKGEEGSMGNPNKRYAVAGPKGGSGLSGLGGGVGSDDRPTLVIRDYFPETLLWAPDVITDDKGHASIKVPFADSITTWRFGLRAVSESGQLGSATLPLVVKQDFFVEASLPVILTQGDEINVPVNVFSYVDGPQDVALEFEADGVSVASGATKTALHLNGKEARGYSFRIRADKAGDRVVRLKAIGTTRADAIEKKISITPNGTPITQTVNGRVSGSAQSFVELPKNAIDGGDDLSIKLYGGPLSQVAEGLEGIFRMPSGCFEQTSSTTYPSILALDFLTKSKSINPELEAKARGFISDGYQRLVTFETSGGGFSVFGKEPASTVLSAYGLMELAEMSRVASVDQVLLDRTRDFLYRRRSSDGGFQRISTYDEKEVQEAKDDVVVTAYVAWALATATAKPEQDDRLKNVLDVVMKKAPLPEGDDPYALALRANALLAGGRANDAKTLLDRLVPQAIRDEHGVHFTSTNPHGGVMYSFGSSFDVEVTALATHALAVASLQPELRAGALNWIVEQKGAYGTWSTTQATVASMRALIDEARPAPKDPQDITIIADGETVETFALEPKARDVHHLTSLRKFATPGKHVIEVRATGSGDVSYQIVAKHYLPFQKNNGTGLSLDVAYGPTTLPANAITSCRVRLAWKAAKDGPQKGEPGRMPLVEIGIPPAFEVESDGLDKVLADKKYGVQRYVVGVGKVTLYMTALHEDQPLDVELPLRALRPAKVMAPASKAYLYYEPEVRAETPAVQLRAL